MVISLNTTIMLRSQWSLQMRISWEVPVDIIVAFLGDSSQKNNHNDFTLQLINDCPFRVIKRQVKYTTFCFTVEIVTPVQSRWDHVDWHVLKILPICYTYIYISFFRSFSINVYLRNYNFVLVTKCIENYNSEKVVLKCL